MKKEIQIAKENIEMFKDNNWKSELLAKRVLIEHKQSCERFLEFLESWEVEKHILGRGEKQINSLWEWLNKKISDLKQAIKLYENNGI